MVKQCLKFHYRNSHQFFPFGPGAGLGGRARRGYDERFESLLEPVGRIPINQLVMHKLLVNQALYAQGLQATQALGVFFDGIARHTPEGFAWQQLAAEKGLRRPSASATSPSAMSASDRVARP